MCYNFEICLAALFIFLEILLENQYQETKKVSVKTGFDLDPKTGLGSSPTNPNNKFVERGRKNQPDFRKEVTIVDGLEKSCKYKI